MNPEKHKRYRLDDGTLISALELSKKFPDMSLRTARTRLSLYTDPKKIFKPKQVRKNIPSQKSYKLRCIYSRGMFDEMLCLVLKMKGKTE